MTNDEFEVFYEVCLKEFEKELHEYKRIFFNEVRKHSKTNILDEDLALSAIAASFMLGADYAEAEKLIYAARNIVKSK